MESSKPFVFTPEMLAAITAPMSGNFHEMWEKYAASPYRRDILNAWAGDDIEKQRAVKRLLGDTY